MYNTQKVYDKLKNLVGWKQPTGFQFDLTTDQKQPVSNRFVTDSDFVKLDFIVSTQQDKMISEANFRLLLDDFVRRGLNNLLESVFSDSDFIDRQLLYKHTNNKVNTISLPSGKFVGVQLEPHHTVNNYAFEISRVLLEFENFPNDVTLLLFNSAKTDAPIRSKTVTVTSSQQVEYLNWVLDDTEDFYRGEYFLGYIADNTSLQPIEREYESSDIESRITGLWTEPIEAPITGTALFDLEDVDHTEQTWGLNPDITVYDDFTDMIIQNQRLFANALQLSTQVEVLKSYLASNRSNRQEMISNDMMNNIKVHLNGINTGEYKEDGLISLLEHEVGVLKREKLKLYKGYFADHNYQSITRS